MMSPEDYQKIVGLKASWSTAPDAATKSSINLAAESIRSKYGYTGGTSGDKFIPSGSPMPSIPSMPSYTSNYGDSIDKALSAFIEREPFSYDPNTDEAYQSFLKTVNKNAERTFNDTIAGTSVGTGGRPNSWASTVAANAMGNVLSQGAAEVSTFRDAAYSMYQQEGQLDLQQLQALMALDETAYGRYIDEFNTEVTRYNMELSSREQLLSEAMNRTDMRGYVSNADSIIIGLPAGTLSQEARNRELDMQEYLAKAKLKAIPVGDGGDGGNPTISRTAISEKDLQYRMEGQFGTIDKQLGGTPESKGEYLITMWESGWFTDVADLKRKASAFGAKLPYIPEEYEQGRTDGTISQEKYNMIQKLYDDITGLHGFTGLYKESFAIKIDEWIKSGKITREEYEAYAQGKVRN